MAGRDQSVSELAKEIKGLEVSFDECSTALKGKWINDDLKGPVEVADKAWRLFFLSHACSRAASLIKNENIGTSSLGTLASARYIFELRILIRNLISGRLFGIVCARSLIEDRLNHETSLLKQHESEIELYERCEAREQKAVSNAAKDPQLESLQSIMTQVDEATRMSLCLYSQKAQHWGYGYWAGRMRSEMIPQLKASIDELERELAEFNERYPLFSDPNALPQKFKWDRAAKQVGLETEYDFIYANTSRVLHCLPGSVAVNQQEQTEQELRMYMRSMLVNLERANAEIRLFLASAAPIKH